MEAVVAEALMEAERVGAACALAAKVVAAHRWESPVARPVKEPSAAAPRAVVVRARVAAARVVLAGASATKVVNDRRVAPR